MYVHANYHGVSEYGVFIVVKADFVLRSVLSHNMNHGVSEYGVFIIVIADFVLRSVLSFNLDSS